jgi:hypothetical protein
MLKNEKLEILFQYASEKGLCRNKKTFAEFIGVSTTNISKIFADTNERFCTNGVLLKANAALGNVFSTQWLLHDQGDMFAQSEPAALEQEVSVSTHQPVQEVVVHTDTRRVELLETLVKTLQHEVNLLERYNNHLEEENEALKKGNSYVYVRAKDA